MDFLEELKWRGMIHDTIPGVEDHLKEQSRIGYIGFDPTADSLTIGNYVQIMLLTLFQRAGHQPIFLIGGATGRIGDPSGKDEERQLKTYEEIDHNAQVIKKLGEKFLQQDGPNPVIIANNISFYEDMNVLHFLRDVGKKLTVNYMLSKDSVKSRLESGMSYTEFSYQLLQGYDFLCLNKRHNCTLQMGGSDQWGNITSGTEFVRRSEEATKVYAVTTPLLAKSDGKKFGKSEQGNIWLSPEKTSPYAFYQFWLNADDADIGKFTRYFTLKSKEEVLANEEEYSDNPNELKRLLAEELTRRVHSDQAYAAAQGVSEIIFKRGLSESALKSFNADTLKMVSQEIPSFEIMELGSLTGMNLIDVLTEHAPIFSSKGEAKRAIKGNALAVNKRKVQSDEALLTADDFLEGGYIFIENGKKNKFIIKQS